MKSTETIALDALSEAFAALVKNGDDLASPRVMNKITDAIERLRSSGEPSVTPHVNCTCPACKPNLWAAGVKGVARPVVHADPTGTTREPPHCPTCGCGLAGEPSGIPDGIHWNVPEVLKRNGIDTNGTSRDAAIAIRFRWLEQQIQTLQAAAKSPGEPGAKRDHPGIHRVPLETIELFARKIVKGGNELRDHECPQCMPEGGDLVNQYFCCTYHLAAYYDAHSSLPETKGEKHGA